MIDRFASGVVETCAKFRKCLELFKLRVSKLQTLCNSAICGTLSLPTNPRNALAYIDRWQDLEFKERRGEVHLTVGDGDEISRNVG